MPAASRWSSVAVCGHGGRCNGVDGARRRNAAWSRTFTIVVGDGEPLIVVVKWGPGAKLIGQVVASFIGGLVQVGFKLELVWTPSV